MKVLFLVTLFCVWCTFITVHAQLQYNPPQCPDELLKLYDRCGGNLDQCSTCLGQVEKECDVKTKKSGACFDCTTIASRRCGGSSSEGCYGDQECGSGRECVNRQCV